MKSKVLLSTAILLFAVAAVAQVPAVGHLTIFSEDGDKFFLVLNGERQNTVAQTNLRVEDLTQDYYTAKIIFEDKTLPEISKNMLPIADPTNGVKNDVTYKIKKNKNNGKLTLNYYSAQPVVQGYVAPSNVYVMHYGKPAPVATNTTITQTTTTTTATPDVSGVDINVGGIKMDVKITDPTMSGTVKQTTTTTHTTTTSTPERHSPTEQPNSTPKQAGCYNSYPMGSGDFASALSTIKNQSFEDSKLKTARQIATSNCLNTTQITQICQAFGFEESKLDFAKYAYDFCTEPKNYFKLNNVFSFSSSSDALNEYIQGK